MRRVDSTAPKKYQKGRVPCCCLDSTTCSRVSFVYTSRYRSTILYQECSSCVRQALTRRRASLILYMYSKSRTRGIDQLTQYALVAGSLVILGRQLRVGCSNVIVAAYCMFSRAPWRSISISPERQSYQDQHKRLLCDCLGFVQKSIVCRCAAASSHVSVRYMFSSFNIPYLHRQKPFGVF